MGDRVGKEENSAINNSRNKKDGKERIAENLLRGVRRNVRGHGLPVCLAGQRLHSLGDSVIDGIDDKGEIGNNAIGSYSDISL